MLFFISAPMGRLSLTTNQAIETPMKSLTDYSKGTLSAANLQVDGTFWTFSVTKHEPFGPVVCRESLGSPRNQT